MHYNAVCPTGNGIPNLMDLSTMPYALQCRMHYNAVCPTGNGIPNLMDLSTMPYALQCRMPYGQCVMAMTLARRAYGIVESLVEDMEMLDAVVESIIWKFS